MKRLIPLLVLLVLAACAGRDKQPTFRGPLAAESQTYWNQMVGALKSKGVAVKSPSRLSTQFVASQGTLGRGNDRFPYTNQAGGKVGGWLSGSCNGGGTMTIARESGGFYNRSIVKHEAGHHVNNHARCGTEKAGHPDYMRTLAGAPHWPYWEGAFAEAPEFVVTPLHVEDDQGNSVCVLYLDVPGDVVPLDTQSARQAFAMSLLGR
jgi:hypothetical protein